MLHFVSVLCIIPRHCGVGELHLIPRDSHALNLNFFLCHQNFDFLQDIQTRDFSNEEK